MAQDLVLHPSPRISQNGTDALHNEGWDHFKIVLGPAGGPKNLATMGFDQHAAAAPSVDHGGPRWLVGGSFSALRNCAIITRASCPDVDVTEQLARAFCEMVWRPGDTCQTLIPMMERLYQLAAPRPADIVYHPSLRLAIMVTSLQPWARSVHPWILHGLFYTFLAANAVSGSVLKHFQTRLCFYTGPEPPPFLADDDSVTCVPLMESNLNQVLHATTCIPFVSQPCTYINGIGEGMYFDGALTDYQLNCLCTDPDMPALLLGIDVENNIKANIWDTVVPWRSVKGHALNNVSILAPTKAFQDKLLGGRFPDTYDFFKTAYVRDPKLRIDAWMRAYHWSVEAVPPHPASLINPAMSAGVCTAPDHQGGAPAGKQASSKRWPSLWPWCGTASPDGTPAHVSCAQHLRWADKQAGKDEAYNTDARDSVHVLAVWEGLAHRQVVSARQQGADEARLPVQGDVRQAGVAVSQQWGTRGGSYGVGWRSPGLPEGLMRWDLGRWAWRVVFSSWHWMD